MPSSVPKIKRCVLGVHATEWANILTAQTISVWMLWTSSIQTPLAPHTAIHRSSEEKAMEKRPWTAV